MFRGTQTSPNRFRNVCKVYMEMCYFNILLLSFYAFLFLTSFTETNTYMESFTLLVDIIAPECNIINMGPKFLQVSELYGLSNAIDGNVVSFHYERKPSLECNIHLSPQEAHLPAHGKLVTGDPERAIKRGDEPESFIYLRQQLGEL